MKVNIYKAYQQQQHEIKIQRPQKMLTPIIVNDSINRNSNYHDILPPIIIISPIIQQAPL